MGAGERRCSSPSCWSFSSTGARHMNECSHTRPPLDCTHMRDLGETQLDEPSQFPHKEQINVWYHFKSLFGSGLLHTPLWEKKNLEHTCSLHILFMKPALVIDQHTVPGPRNWYAKFAAKEVREHQGQPRWERDSIWKVDWNSTKAVQHRGYEQELGAKQPGFKSQCYAYCLTLSNLLNFSVPQFCLLLNGDNQGTHQTRSL